MARDGVSLYNKTVNKYIGSDIQVFIGQSDLTEMVSAVCV